MSIQWYPGHMHKAIKQIKEVLPKIDLIIEMLDARIPYSSGNPVISQLSGNKPRIKILNKSDLADPQITLSWQKYWEEELNIKSITLAPNQPEKIKQLSQLIKKRVPGKDNTSSEKGGQIINVMIMGIPNVGKSTLINTLTGRALAKTGNEPAVTKGQQRINLGNGISLLDTPGILWPKVDNKKSGYRLAATGAIRDTAMSYDDVAFNTVDYLLKAYPLRLRERYQLNTLPVTELEFLEAAGAKRGCLRSGGMVDLEKIATVFLNELRNGMLGRISLETPSMMVEEEEELAHFLAKIAAEKEAKKAARKKKKLRR
ncbi:MAG: ribosome biogenesis GTPase YlqF [Pseudomonadales bacterium]|nr:ribosome biogenesis GTPase YlqF [Pseudomonadales bacterium]